MMKGPFWLENRHWRKEGQPCSRDALRRKQETLLLTTFYFRRVGDPTFWKPSLAGVTVFYYTGSASMTTPHTKRLWRQQSAGWAQSLRQGEKCEIPLISSAARLCTVSLLNRLTSCTAKKELSKNHVTPNIEDIFCWSGFLIQISHRKLHFCGLKTSSTASNTKQFHNCMWVTSFFLKKVT